MFKKKKYVQMNLNYLLGFVYSIIYITIFVYPKTLCAQVEEAWVSFLSCYVWVIVIIFFLRNSN